MKKVSIALMVALSVMTVFSFKPTFKACAYTPMGIPCPVPAEEGKDYCKYHSSLEEKKDTLGAPAIRVN